MAKRLVVNNFGVFDIGDYEKAIDSIVMYLTIPLQLEKEFLGIIAALETGDMYEYFAQIDKIDSNKLLKISLSDSVQNIGENIATVLLTIKDKHVKKGLFDLIFGD